MRVELRITSGSRAGQRELFEKSVISIGRHPMNDLRFHAERDPDVSSKHAEIRVVGGKATLHDLKSTNGTFVNGQRLEMERALFDGDLIAFGDQGPRVEFHVVTAVAPAADPTPVVPVRAATGTAPKRRNTMERIAEAVEQQTGKLRTMVLALGGLVVVGAGVAYWIGHRDSARAQTQIAALLHRNDSLTSLFEQTVRTMKGRVAGLDSALAADRQEGVLLRSRIRDAQAKGGGNVIDLSAQLDAAESRQRALVSAARVDYEAIAASNGRGVVFIASEQAAGDVVSGSGFNVAANGLVVTNRHVVQDEQGRPAKRVAVIFDNTQRWLHAHVVKVSATDEMAFIRIDERGPFPTVSGVSKTGDLRVGAPVAIIGYPLGTSTAGMSADISKVVPKSTLGVGTVSKVLADTVQFDAFAAPGSSGSPVFDARGLVVGVLFGGAAESGGRIVYAVPSRRLAAQLPPDGAGIVR